MENCCSIESLPLSGLKMKQNKNVFLSLEKADSMAKSKVRLRTVSFPSAGRIYPGLCYTVLTALIVGIVRL